VPFIDPMASELLDIREEAQELLDGIISKVCQHHAPRMCIIIGALRYILMHWLREIKKKAYIRLGSSWKRTHQATSVLSTGKTPTP
jgi:hypothetical protein